MFQRTLRAFETCANKAVEDTTEDKGKIGDFYGCRFVIECYVACS